MSNYELDAVDRGILHLLQQDARNNTPADIADIVGVAPNTVRNRLERLETSGVVNGYHPHIDYERAGYQLRVWFFCTVPISDRTEIADRLLTIDGVIQVVEILSGQNNIATEVVAESSDDLTEIATEIEDIGGRIENEMFLKNTRVQPFDHFSVEDAGEGD